MKEKLNKLLNIFTSILVYIVAILAVLLVGVRLFGLQLYTVLSPSMAPYYPTGSLVYVKQVDPATLKVDDVITFKLSSTTTATHRIIEIVHDKTDSVRFRTKGDNNQSADPSLVGHEKVIGKVVFSIPLLGYIATFLQQPPGMYIAITISAISLIIMIITEHIVPDKKEKSTDNT